MNKIKIGSVRFNLDNRTLEFKDKEIQLPNSEFLILSHLLNKKINTRESISEVLGYTEHGIELRTIDQHVHRLRLKLGKEGKRIITVNTVGYRLKI